MLISLWLGLFAPAAVFAEDQSRPVPLPALPSGISPCVRRTGMGLQGPASLSDLLDCQSRLRQSWIAGFTEAKGAPPPGKSLDQLDGYQREEARRFLQRHPDLASTVVDTPKASAPNTAKEPGKARGGRCRSQTAPVGGAGKAPSKEFAAQQQRTAAAMDKNLAGQDPELSAELGALGDFLNESSQGGELGVTPAGAARILEFLDCQQGGANADMQDLLHHVARDGPKLQHDTVLRLKRASREAKGSGLDLGVEPGMEKWLLDPKTDPADDPNGPYPTSRPNSN